ncbi:septum site-determining protein MinC [Caldicellulosiruptor obsidiansis OB47]|uniref:Probable septum site-determining protein MinC n=1 Tax=Caldicellulosiruptor obsidiansis (strain ATCC BAA-2073 / JCM 16842 / OB47) TaxID=608506 RepID=D9TKL2_CALOO|nr:septum site-determining protein MinC [Caldicellulosiruptor obsidiansis]ADL42544.1 septum site-determining protein MinC [Caldicellulosiruptor obsidiansis OB47]
MNEPVVLKGFGKGIAVILDSSCDFEIICDHFKQKVINGKNFFSGYEIPIQFIGRRLNSYELQKLIEIMKTFGGVHDIIFPWDEISFHNLLSTVGESSEDIKEEQLNAKIHKGTLRSGQVITSESDLIIIGDVNPGAEVISKNNIIVLGALRGIAHAGISGNKNAVVFALEMDPVQIRIANIIARAPDEDNKHEKGVAEIAYIENETIVVKPVTQF